MTFVRTVYGVDRRMFRLHSVSDSEKVDVGLHRATPRRMISDVANFSGDNPPSDVVIETAVSARRSIETGF